MNETEIKSKIRSTFDLPKQVEALQTAIDIYLDHEAFYETALELLKILQYFVNNAANIYMEINPELQKLVEAEGHV